MKQHDFTNRNTKSGWRIAAITRHPQGDYEIIGIGSGIEKGDSLILTADDGENCQLPVSSIEYNAKQKDNFVAQIDARDIQYREPTP